MLPDSVAVHSQRILGDPCLPSLVDNRPQISANDHFVKLLIFIF
ncbi:hypothetical protein C4K30_2630 [Pseudomonas chlororaphis subsp. piscium]|nr:hypothetical protein C4K30_2630 [Pseudomonas chlororaphis subsp. piscium]